MNQMKIVNYKSAKAYYNVESNGQSFVATLKKYMGDDHHMPPRRVTYLKNGNATNRNLPYATSLLEDVSRATSKR